MYPSIFKRSLIKTAVDIGKYSLTMFSIVLVFTFIFSALFMVRCKLECCFPVHFVIFPHPATLSSVGSFVGTIPVDHVVLEHSLVNCSVLPNKLAPSILISFIILTHVFRAILPAFDSLAMGNVVASIAAVGRAS